MYYSIGAGTSPEYKRLLLLTPRTSISQAREFPGSRCDILCNKLPFDFYYPQSVPVEFHLLRELRLRPVVHQPLQNLAAESYTLGLFALQSLITMTQARSIKPELDSLVSPIDLLLTPYLKYGPMRSEVACSMSSKVRIVQPTPLEL